MTRYGRDGGVDTVRLSAMDRGVLGIAAALITLLLAATFAKVWQLSEAVALNKQTTESHSRTLEDHERRLRDLRESFGPRSSLPGPEYAGAVALAHGGRAMP